MSTASRQPTEVRQEDSESAELSPAESRPDSEDTTPPPKPTHAPSNAKPPVDHHDVQSKESGFSARFIFDVITAAFIQLLLKLRGLVLLPILTKLGDARLYGSWVQLAGLLSLLATNLGLNLHQSLMRYAAPLDASRARALYRRVGTVSFLIGVAFTLLLFLAYRLNERAVELLLTGSFGQQAALDLTLVQIPLVVLATTNVAYLRSRQRSAIAQLSDVLQQLLSAAAAALALLAGYGLPGAQGASGLVLLFHVLVTGAAALLGGDTVRAVGNAEVPSFATMVRYALPYLPSNLSVWVLSTSDRYILGYFHGASVVGQYSAAYSLGQSLLLFTFPFDYLLGPVLSRNWDAGNRRQASHLVALSLRIASVGLLFAAAFFAFYGPTVLAFLSTPDIGRAAVELLPGIVLGVVAYAWTRMPVLLLTIAGKGYLTARLLVGSALVNLVLTVVLTPRFAALGAALATVIGYALLLAFLLMMLHRYAPGTFPLGSLARTAVAVVVTVGVVRFLFPPSGLLVALLGGLCALVVYLPALRLVGAVTAEELQALRTIAVQALRNRLRRSRNAS